MDHLAGCRCAVPGILCACVSSQEEIVMQDALCITLYSRGEFVSSGGTPLYLQQIDQKEDFEEKNWILECLTV